LGFQQERVKAEFWKWFKCEDGQEERADKHIEKTCKSRISNMHYEERITLTIKYYAEHLSQKINKAEARQSLLTQEQFLEMIPWWCASYADCWEKIVNSWFVPGVAEDRDSHRDRAKQKQDPTHHQGSSSLSGYQKNGYGLYQHLMYL